MRMLSLICLAAALPAAETRIIPNPLGQEWPWELVSMDFTPGAVQPGWVATIAGVSEPRPTQIEKILVEGKPVERVWFIATVDGKQKEVAVTFDSGRAASPLTITSADGFTVVDTGIAELRLRLGQGKPGAALNDQPHWLGGVRVKGTPAWDGRAQFFGTSVVTKVVAQTVANGPVFAEWRLSYEFADAADSGTIEAMPLMLGKHSFRYPINRIPTETIPRQERRYEVAIRAVANDPWIEVAERYRLPRDEKVKDWGIHQWMLAFGEGEGGPGMPVDTVLWTRWFEYDAFGGNNKQLLDPARPRSAQKGRPFIQMRPRWNQGPGGGQDALLTSGGTTAKASPDAAAVGLVAAYPSKWSGPYDATISMQAYEGNRGVFRLPLTNGGKHAATQEPIHYGGRCWALVAAPRSVLEGRMDGLIRRHSDWTLTALINHYQLTWPGMGSGKDGPNPGQYLSLRYQADDVNPTNYGNRRMVNDAFWEGKGEAKKIKGAAAFGPSQAAVGYIYSDLDSWPGWHNGWGPGNPNFHTDKYMASIFAAMAMPGHPHAKDWLAFGRSCYDGDLAKVLTPPDGAGSECPGYAGYSLGLQAEIAKSVFDAGQGNWLGDNPLVRKTLTWHRKLLTPFDQRLGLRHESPIGDTHRWTSGADFKRFVPFFAKVDAVFAKELDLAEALTKAKSPGAAGAGGLDWSSQAFAGFGAILRHRFGEPEESFLSLKSGFLQGHYHNEDQSFHWYHRGTPISLDYNCSYHPRGDHAALHNTVTFGGAGTVENNTLKKKVDALDQPFGNAGVVSFVSTPQADLVVADRRISALAMSPLDPHDAEFGRDYPSRSIKATHRRLLLLSKHPAGSPLSDYLVVRDEIDTNEPQQVNLHLLARDARIDGGTVRLTGQWNQDILVQIQATELKVEHRQWNYFDEWMAPPTDFLPKPGETTAQWDARLPKERPKQDWKPTFMKRDQTEANAKAWHEALAPTDGMALMPPPGWTSTWTYGECQRWLRLHSKPGTPIVTVIYPFVRGAPEPIITLAGDAITVTVGATSERLVLSSSAGARFGDSELLKPAALPAIR